MATFLWLALGIFVVATAAFLIYILTRKRTADQNTDDKKVDKENSKKTIRKNREETRISPKTFSVGPIITEGRYVSSNLCDNTKLFPMKDIYVNYGPVGRIPDNARCTEYIQPP